MEITSDCPTIDNKINCSECTHECKLRMQPEVKVNSDLPESELATIYYQVDSVKPKYYSKRVVLFIQNLELINVC